MKMKWEKSRIDIYNIASAEAILAASDEIPDDPNYSDDDLGEDKFGNN